MPLEPHSVCHAAWTLPRLMAMTGITNHPEKEEQERQQIVERNKDRLPDFEAVNRPRKDHPMDKDQEEGLEGRGRVSETGAGRGLDHSGH